MCSQLQNLDPPSIPLSNYKSSNEIYDFEYFSTCFEYSSIQVRSMSFVLVMLLSKISLNRNSIVWIWKCNVRSVCHGHFYLKVHAFIESNVPKLDTI